MANKAPSWISTLVVGLLAAVGRAPASAQTAGSAAANPVVQRRCTTVALTSDTPMLPVRLIEPYLQQKADFQASKLVFAEEQASADATVSLGRSGERNTRIEVLNNITGRHVSAISLWTEYPGMIAADVMDQLRAACPGSVVARPEPPRAVAECRKPAAELRSVATIAGCSQTSWMDTRDIYKALESRPELKRWSVKALPACTGGDAVLDITHNLDLTVEWFWTLRAHGGQAISRGRVIAFDAPTAAQKITDQLTREIALARGEELTSPENVTQHDHEDPAIWNVKAHVLRSDFSDSRIALTVDNETVTGRDAGGKVAFAFSLEDLLDVRRRKLWDHPLQLWEPTGLVNSLETATTDEQVIGAVEALVIYTSVGALLTQVRTPVSILDLAWQENGAVKTVSIQASAREVSRLLHALRAEASTLQEPICSSGTSQQGQEGVSPSTGQDGNGSVAAPESHSRGFRHFMGRTGFYIDQCAAQAQENVPPITGPVGSGSVTSHQSQSRGFKLFVERAAFYAGEGMLCATVLAGGIAMGGAMAAN